MSVEKHVGSSERVNANQKNGHRNDTVEVYTTSRGETDTKEEKISSLFTILAAGFGMISDGYQNSLMTMANVMFKVLYPKYYTSAVSTQVSNALLIGDIIGQLSVGYVCDRFGRKFALVGITCLIVLGATLATAAHGANGSPVGLFWFLTIARGITGVGIGGEYPASSTSASESANERSIKSRGPTLIMVTNFVLCFGGPVGMSVFLIVLSAAGENHLNTVWRVCFGIGIALPLSVLFFRLRMLSSKLYRKTAIKHRVPYKLVFKRYWRSLIGTCGTWFLLDFVAYPNYMFSGTIINSVIHDGSIKRTAEWQLLLGVIALPGVFVGAWLLNPLGTKYTMMLGFTGYVIFGLIIGIAYDQLENIIPLFVVFYGLMLSVANVGPGNVTIVASAESYATPVRGTCYGLSAAMGKVGAAISTEAFTPIQDRYGKRWTFIVAAICGILGIVLSYFFTLDLSKADLNEEDAKFLKYLRENDWDGQVGEKDDRELIESSNRRGCFDFGTLRNFHLELNG